MLEKEKSEYENVISTYYGDDQVTALITLKIDTKDAEAVAERISEYDVVEDVFLVTGDTDVMAKVKFQNYNQLKRFLVEKVANVQGVKDIKTLMVVMTFKERGELKVEPTIEKSSEGG
ncbi:MAG: Lrp/AsnC ligand binding domain-containing protein [Methanomassiliicoccales archaeon]|jgi:DNA-binding Lrp family transcriptional regulator|nr:Lrp/AsnC ligand binding domain-containing protein [Methanomassiliicoccales archaeon]